MCCAFLSFHNMGINAINMLYKYIFHVFNWLYIVYWLKCDKFENTKRGLEKVLSQQQLIYLVTSQLCNSTILTINFLFWKVKLLIEQILTRVKVPLYDFNSCFHLFIKDIKLDLLNWMKPVSKELSQYITWLYGSFEVSRSHQKQPNE